MKFWSCMVNSSKSLKSRIFHDLSYLVLSKLSRLKTLVSRKVCQRLPFAKTLVMVGHYFLNAGESIVLQQRAFFYLERIYYGQFVLFYKSIIWSQKYENITNPIYCIRKNWFQDKINWNKSMAPLLVVFKLLYFLLSKCLDLLQKLN